MQHSQFSILNNPLILPPAMGQCAAAIGNFDGVHLGHQSILAQLCDYSAQNQLSPLLVTFSPHTKTYFNSKQPIPLLTQLPQKTALLKHFGLSGCIVLSFNEKLASLSATQFSTYLFKDLGLKAIFVGENFYFGKNKQGNPQFLIQQAAQYNAKVFIVPIAEHNKQIISSTQIRSLLSQGQCEAANAQLGYPYFINAQVIHGEKIGSELGYPTANMALDANSPLKVGIYVVRCQIGTQWHHGVASYGRKPTIGNFPPLLEVYIFDFAQNIYGRNLTVEFLHYLRPEFKFDNLEDLKAQMKLDEQQALNFFSQQDK